MSKKLKVRKGTDGTTLGGYSTKPRFYVIVNEFGNKLALSKIYTHYPNNKKHKEKLDKELRKPIKNFKIDQIPGTFSVVDKKLYVKDINGNPIYKSKLNYHDNIFEFNEQQSKSILKFIFSDKKNKDSYLEFRNIKKDKKK